MIKVIITALTITVLAACTSQTTAPTKPAKPADSASISCGDERPQVCTREYRPVCGKRDNGVRCVTTPCPSVEYKTYATACTACADENVISYVVGACEE